MNIYEYIVFIKNSLNDLIVFNSEIEKLKNISYL